MKDDLLLDLEHCSRLLGLNDLEGNNLSIQLDKIEKITDNIYESISNLRQIQELVNEITNEIALENSIKSKIESMQYKIKKLEDQSIILDIKEMDNSQRILGNILGNNLKAFLIINKLIKEL